MRVTCMHFFLEYSQQNLHVHEILKKAFNWFIIGKSQIYFGHRVINIASVAVLCAFDRMSKIL